MIASFCSFVALVCALFFFRFICILLQFFLVEEKGCSSKSVLDPQVEEKAVISDAEEEEEEESMFEFKFNYQNIVEGSIKDVVSTAAINDQGESDKKLQEDLIASLEIDLETEGNSSNNSIVHSSSESFDSENQDLEYIWEHQDLIEQLKMEVRKVEAIGLLPTISEEPNQSPMYIKNLKIWKIDTELLNDEQHPSDELQRHHKIYREKMRKLDLLYHQKMYAIGILQLKDPLWSLESNQKGSIVSFFRKNIGFFTGLLQLKDPVWSLGFRKNSSHIGDYDVGPSEMLVKDFHADMESIYIGQTCLSWECLRWQYEVLFRRDSKSKSDNTTKDHSLDYIPCNKTTKEFQHFQTSIRKLLETESVNGGGRIQNYVKNRSILRNLLQVPLISDAEEGSLEQVVEKSMRIFWEFLKTDKDETSTITDQKQLITPSDHALFIEIQVDLHKKEKKMKMKEIASIGNCFVSKFKKRHQSRSRQNMFFSQVDMKLVSRVLKLSRLRTDQLLWCQTKLDKIRFVDDKIHRESSSFSIFPC